MLIVKLSPLINMVFHVVCGGFLRQLVSLRCLYLAVVCGKARECVPVTPADCLDEIIIIPVTSMAYMHCSSFCLANVSCACH